ncbi:hypothetical protein [Nodosilinea sp. P-1105]|uniref:hypothetical protein n=1 Tax=Nodosilinea sp. P-1105 TaxID=2546229 RepID=UPI00146E6336|nr:hypothetical protein [Nodosilinea sp. P-1105]NMF85321.1 hypothetical protein [Nodosilinea sp. P-1105]
MLTDLLGATQTYWRKLDDIEAAYRRDELSIDEVDIEVKRLMQELGHTRRRALREFGASARYFVAQQRDVLAGTAVMGLLTYIWWTNIA